MKNEQYDRLLSPSPAEFTLLLLELFAPLYWRIRNLRPTETIARLLGHGFDPEGSKLPPWELKGDRQPIYADETEIRDGGFAIGYGKNGLEYSEPTTKAQAKAEKTAEDRVGLTYEEREIMKAYNPPLLNIALACKIKQYWLAGHSDKEVAILTPCSRSYAKHHRLAFEKARKTT